METSCRHVIGYFFWLGILHTTRIAPEADALPREEKKLQPPVAQWRVSISTRLTGDQPGAYTTDLCHTPIELVRYQKGLQPEKETSTGFSTQGLTYYPWYTGRIIVAFLLSLENNIVNVGFLLYSKESHWKWSSRLLYCLFCCCLFI